MVSFWVSWLLHFGHVRSIVILLLDVLNFVDLLQFPKSEAGTGTVPTETATHFSKSTLPVAA
jgi:hypothetical protein